MGWNPFIDLRVERVRGVRSQCKQCKAPIDKDSFRVEAIPVVGKPEQLHVDCAAKRAPDVAQRKLKDKDPGWPEDALTSLGRYVKADVVPAPRSFQRTPILDLSYGREPAARECVYCGSPAPGAGGPGLAHAVRAFSIDGERRFHAACIAAIAPGLCRRVVVEASDRWPAEVRAFFAAAVPQTVSPTARSPWRDTAGLPWLERAASARAACRFCEKKLDKGELRLGRERLFGMRRSPVFFHVACYARSDDYHPRMLELVVIKAAAEVTREDVAGLAPLLPATPAEDDDVPPLVERLLYVFDLVRKKQPAPGGDGAGAGDGGLVENRVEIPDGFFGDG